MLDLRTAVGKCHGKSCHNAQNCYQLYTCLLDSITREKFLKVSAVAEQYVLGATKEPTGVCFLWLLIQSAIIHTRATVNTIQKSLYPLEPYMAKVDTLKCSTNISCSNAKHSCPMGNQQLGYPPTHLWHTNASMTPSFKPAWPPSRMPTFMAAKVLPKIASWR